MDTRYFILDTSVLRGHLRRLPAPRDGVVYVVPAMAIQELLAQALREPEREKANAALRIFERKDVEVAPETGDRMRYCFGRDPEYPESADAYKHLADHAASGCSERSLRRLWRGFDDANVIAYGPDWVAEVKDGEFERDLSRMAGAQRGILREAREQLVAREALRAPLPSEGTIDLTKGQILRHWVDQLTGEGIPRMWLLNQAAAAAGVEGLHEVLLAGYGGSTMEEVYAVAQREYRGGLELLIALNGRLLAETVLDTASPRRNDLPDLLIAANVEDGDDHVLVTEETSWHRLADLAVPTHAPPGRVTHAARGSFRSRRSLRGERERPVRPRCVRPGPR